MYVDFGFGPVLFYHRGVYTRLVPFKVRNTWRRYAVFFLCKYLVNFFKIYFL